MMLSLQQVGQSALVSIQPIKVSTAKVTIRLLIGTHEKHLANRITARARRRNVLYGVDMAPSWLCPAHSGQSTQMILQLVL